MSEVQWPAPFVTMYQRVLRVKQAMEQEEVPVSLNSAQLEEQQDEKALLHDSFPTPEVYNEETDIFFSWDYLEKRGEWKKWHDWEQWDSWNK